jgi:hypothetical protein
MHLKMMVCLLDAAEVVCGARIARDQQDAASRANASDLIARSTPLKLGIITSKLSKSGPFQWKASSAFCESVKVSAM